jgi:5-deoxy-glucuronate isomerase
MPDARWRGKWLALELRALESGESRTVAAAPRDECAVVLLQGAVRWLGRDARRDSTFTERASAAYVPPGTSIEVDAHDHAELAVVTTTTADLEPRGEPLAIDPGAITTEWRGGPGFRRAVHDVIAPSVPAQRLLVGETFNEPGEWSSFPPHRHDGRDGEPPLEEVYAFRFDHPDGFGFIGLYGGERTAEDAVFLRHGSIVGFASGYHPVSAAPGCRLMYLWALAGPERRLVMVDDPAHIDRASGSTP